MNYYKLNMSAGEFFDLVWPVVLLVSALISIWVLVSARKHFPWYLALAWAVATIFFPFIILPLYLAVLLLARNRTRTTTPPRARFLMPVVYGIAVVSGVVVYNSWDKNTVDSHLARAAQADLVSDRVRAVREYKQALSLEDNAHTHKLLAIQFADMGMWSDAIAEFRLAEAGGEPDDLIHYRLAQMMERINNNGEAGLEYEKFLLTKMCNQEPVDSRCNHSQQRLAGIRSLE
ncbi:MAG TPA: hypothetical protein VKB46_19845 [Pyrinomonadaceae bacterium]|nr:hypothetical protein [Pyrinomonadaceae bacterium]